MTRPSLRWLISPALLVLVVGGIYAFSRLSVDPELEARNTSLRDELTRLEARNGRLEDEVSDLKAEIARLRSDDAESLFHARTQLGMVRTGEVVYQLRPEAPPRPATP